jgi:pimeloyl-ACP methyl ester carboxylesterase
MRKNWRWLLLALMAFVVVLSVGVVVATRPAEPMPQALAALQSDTQVEAATRQWIVFTPRAREPSAGFIFYPGGLVDARAYAPMARDIAAQGYLVVIVPMPLNLAFFDANRAKEVIANYPAIKRWVIGGHSLGGVAAAMFVKNHLQAIQGLAFWASYPAEALTDAPVRVLSIYGTQDGLSTPAKINNSRALLPANAQFVAIQGGNHAQFGWYGAQSGDGSATISREEQQRQIVSTMVAWLKQISGE